MRMLPSALRGEKSQHGDEGEGRSRGKERGTHRRRPTRASRLRGRGSMVRVRASRKCTSLSLRRGEAHRVVESRLTERREPDAVDDAGVLAEGREVLDLGLGRRLVGVLSGGRRGGRRRRGGRSGLLGGEREGGRVRVRARRDEPELRAGACGRVSERCSGRYRDRSGERCRGRRASPARAAPPRPRPPGTARREREGRTRTLLSPPQVASLHDLSRSLESSSRLKRSLRAWSSSAARGSTPVAPSLAYG